MARLTPRTKSASQVNLRTKRIREITDNLQGMQPAVTLGPDSVTLSQTRHHSKHSGPDALAESRFGTGMARLVKSFAVARGRVIKEFRI